MSDDETLTTLLETAKLLAQWSRSAETRLKSLNENEATFAQAMASLAESQARFSESQASLAEEHKKLAAEHTRLAAAQAAPNSKSPRSPTRRFAPRVQ